MPENKAGTGKVMEKLASISTNMYPDPMGQYGPGFMTMQYPGVIRSITPEEYAIAREQARKTGLVHLA
jgi:uncharacterized Fe-S radical SAM superfamily protein PflX